MADDTPDKPEGKVEKTTSSTGTEMKGRLEGDRKRKGLPSAWGSKEEREERGVRRAEALRQQQETAYNPPEEVNVKSLLKYFSANAKEGVERALLGPLGFIGDAIYQARRLDPGQKKLAFKNMFLGTIASSVGGFGLVGTVFANKLRNQQTFAGDPQTETEVTRQNFMAVASGFQAYDKNFKQIEQQSKLNAQGLEKINASVTELSGRMDKTFAFFEKRGTETERQIKLIGDTIERIERFEQLERKRTDILTEQVDKINSRLSLIGQRGKVAYDGVATLGSEIGDVRKDFQGEIARVDKDQYELHQGFDSFYNTTKDRLTKIEGMLEIINSNNNGSQGNGGGAKKPKTNNTEQTGGPSLLEMLGGGAAGAGLFSGVKKIFGKAAPKVAAPLAGKTAGSVASKALPWLKRGLKVGGLAGGMYMLMGEAAYGAVKSIGDDNEKRDQELGITPDMTQEQISAIRKKANVERRNKGMKEENAKSKQQQPQLEQQTNTTKKGLFGWGGLPKGKPISTEVSFERMKTEEEKSQFLQFGALPKGFEFLQGGRGRLGSSAAVAASGAVPIADYMGGVGPAGGSGGPVSGPGSVTREAQGYSSGRFTNSGKDWGGVQNPTLGGSQFASPIPDHMKYRMSEGVVTPEGKRVDRSRFDDDLKKPEVRAALAARAQIEVGSQSGSQKWLESVMNRASSRGQSLMDTVNNIDGYYPQKDNRRFRELSRDQSLLPRWDKMIDTVHKDGTNLARGATGNESRDVQSSGAPIVASGGGERYVLEHRDRKWKPSFVDVDPNRKADVTKVSPEQVSASPDSSVVQIQGQVASIRRLKITDELETRLDYAAQQSGVKFEVSSGGQSHRTGIKGSFRHNVDRGTIGAADGRMYVVEDGKKRYLSIYNRDDRAQIASFTRHFTSVTEGAGVGTNYMGDNRTDRGQLFHFGGPNVKGGVAKPYLGPDWFKAAHAAGLSDKDAQKKFEKWKSERTDTEQIKDAKKFYQDNGVPIPKNIKELVKPTSRAPVQEATKVSTPEATKVETKPEVKPNTPDSVGEAAGGFSRKNFRDFISPELQKMKTKVSTPEATKVSTPEATKVETKPVEYAQPNPDGSIPEPSAPTAAPVEKVATEPEVKAPEVKESNIEPMSAADAKAGVGEPKVDSKDIEPMSPEDTKPKQAASSSSESSGGSGGGNGGEGRQSFRNNPESKAATPGNGGYGSFGRCFVIYEWR